MRTRMDPCDVEYFAENKLINVFPNFRADKIYLLTGDIGPFQPGLSTLVPIWVAITLKQRRKCRIECPSWMFSGIRNFIIIQDNLTEIKNLEKSIDIFAHPPHEYYIEIGKKLLKWCGLITYISLGLAMIFQTSMMLVYSFMILWI
ncbi:hypothetical protein HZS_6472 [Henneguya salminicola]|nr:hypothetical protein HZS_6472 [Henneguya salminicola]